MASITARVGLALGLFLGDRAVADPLFTMPPGQETRWITPENPTGSKGAGAQENKGAKGHAFESIPIGEALHLADISGPGIIDRIWMTIEDRSPQALRGLVLRMWWDGADKPAVEVPLGDFFLQGAGTMERLETALFASPEGRSFVSYVPMPFRKGARISIANESGRPVNLIFFDVDYRKVRRQPSNMLYFHAWWHRDQRTKLGEDFEILPRVRGYGRFLGSSVTVNTNPVYHQSWWGEGEVKIYLDGDAALPTLNGTGTEDYVGTGYGQGAYSQRFQGAPIADHEHQRYAFYRYHVNDPVFFKRDVRVTIQQIGFLWSNDGTPEKPVTPPLYQAGAGRRELDLRKLPQANLFERADDWSSCVYFYLDRPDASLPKLAPVAERIAGL